MKKESLDSLLARARARNGTFVAASPAELEQVGKAASVLLQAIVERKPIERARRALSTQHLEIVQTQLGAAPALAIVEMSGHRAGRGLYVFRTTDVGREWLVQVPHSFFDEDTLPIGREIAARGARGLFVNTVHRYPNGVATGQSSAEDERGSGADPSAADLAHQRESVWQRLTLATLQAFPNTLVLQLHGFADRADSEHEKTSVVVSPSVVQRGEQAADALVTRLREALPELETRLYPRDTRVLGARTNTQAQLVAKRAPARFVHVEVARTLRRRLVTEPALMQSFVAAVWGGTDE